MDEPPPGAERAALAEKLRDAEERAERAREEAARLRRELGANPAPAVTEAGPDFRPALRFLVPVALLEALGALTILALAWRDIAHEDVPPPAVTVAGTIIGFLGWPALLLA